MSANEIIIYTMVFFVVVGAADRIFGSRLRLGNKFEDGLMAMGTLTISTGGVLILAPLLGNLVRPFVVPFFTKIGADPAMFSGLILGLDTGGAPLAKELMVSQDGYVLAMITSSMLGDTISFNIPIAMTLTPKEYRSEVAKGILIGIITIPLAVLAGGIVAGIAVGTIIANLMPVIVLAVIIIICLWKFEKAIIRVFVALGRIVIGISIAGLCIGTISSFTPLQPFNGITPLDEALSIIGNVAVILAGAYVLVELITRILKSPLEKAGRAIGVNDASMSGLLVILANSIPIYQMMPEMNSLGRIVTAAFCVSGSFVFGDHLGFIAGYAPEMTTALVVAKLTGAISAAILAILVTVRKRGQQTQ